MEKLQAALQRARQKRDNEPPSRIAKKTEATQRGTTRRIAQSEALSERWSRIPMFDPSSKRMHQSRIFASEATNEAQHFDILRTKLLLEMRRNSWTRIAITSATAACGKTTMACNLIAGLGRQPELRGILFDMDFRRPSVSKFFGASPTASLDDVLSGRVPFSDQAMRLDKNTAISMTTKVVHDPGQVILSGQTAEVLDEIQADYKPDIMLFDLPPALVADESRGFLKLVDAVLIVAGSDHSTVAQVDEVEREVAQYTNVAGIVLNKCRFIGDGYGYTY